ncbi:hypothetical protein [Aliikangiella sp. G2MR2-5]|uniref:hypothetical protein n=1 Tax=Aliikangiella sp. G2MR2-5 TaxID=2788943 RepID=UPI0018AB90D4|nr:hypothetical protein [Aliikangiella sp. G2MR2-5]
MIKPLFITGFVLLTLAGCQPGVDSPQEDMQMEQKSVNQWQIINGEVKLNNVPLSWDSNKVPGCEACRIETRTEFHPSGPVSNKLLFENDKFRAIQGTAHLPWLTSFRNGKPVKINMLFEKEKKKLWLKIESELVELSSHSKISFSFKSNDYQLWVSRLIFSDSDLKVVPEKNDFKLEYLLVQN